MPKREERFSIRLDLQGGREVTAGLERVGSQGERSLSRIRTMSVAVSKAIAGMVGGVTAVAGVITAAGAAFHAAADRAIRHADAIAKTADAAGVAVERYQSLRYAAERAGIASSQFDEGLQRLNRRLGLFVKDGGGPAAAGFKALGVSVEQAREHLAGTEDAFDLVVDALSKVTSESEKAALASLFFGDRVGGRFVTLMRDGAAGVAALEARARDLGIVMDEHLIRAAEGAGDAMDDVTDVLKTRMTVAVIENAEEIDRLARLLAENLGPAVDGVIGLFTFGAEAAEKFRLGLASISYVFSEETAQRFLTHAERRVWWTNELLEAQKELADLEDDLFKKSLRHRMAVSSAEERAAKARAELARLDAEAEFDAFAEAARRSAAAVDNTESAITTVIDTTARLNEQYQILLATYDPLLKAEREHGERLAEIEKLRAEGLGDEEYAKLLEAENAAHAEAIKKLEARGKATGRAAKETDKLAREEERRLQAGADYLEQMDQENRLLELQLTGREAEIPLLEAEARLRGTLGRDLYPAEIKALENLIDRRQELNAAIAEQKDAARLAEASAREWQRIWENAADNIQDSLSDAFRSALDGNVRSFRDFGRALLEMFKVIAAQIASMLVFRPMVGNVMTSLGGAFGIPGLTTQGTALLDQATSGLDLFGGGLFSDLTSSVTSAITSGFEGFAFSSLGQTLGLSAFNIATGPAAGSFAAAQQAGLLWNAGQGALGLTGTGSLLATAASWILPVAAIALPLIAGMIDNGPRNVNARRFLELGPDGSLVADMDRVFNWKGQAGPEVFDALDDLTGGFLDVVGQIRDQLDLTLSDAIADITTQGSSGEHAGRFFAYFNDREGLEGWVSLFDEAGEAFHASAQDALDAAIRDLIAGGYLQSGNAAIDRALAGAGDANYFEDLDAQGALTKLTEIISFVENFDDSLETLRQGGLDFADAIGIQARQQIDATITSLQVFLQTTADLGLSVTEARSAAQDYLEIFIGLSDIAEPLSALEQAVAALAAKRDALMEAADALAEFGITVEDIAAGVDRAARLLRRDFNHEVNRQILAIANPARLDALDFLAGVDQLFTDAAAVGGDLAQVQRLVGLQKQQLVDSYAEEADEAERLAESLHIAAGKLDRFRGVVDSLGDLRAGLLVDDTLSPLSNLGRLQEAETQFADIARRAQLGDIDAIESLEGVSRKYLAEARDYYASSKEYYRVFQSVQDVLLNTESVAERQVGLLEMQVDHLEAQIEATNTVNASVQDVLAAIADLAPRFDLTVTPRGKIVPKSNVQTFHEEVTALTGFQWGQGADFVSFFATLDAATKDLLRNRKRALGFSQGGLFHGDAVIPFGSGGIVNRPTTFPLGLMGEAGPEAILPLGSVNGRLGVHAASPTVDPEIRTLLRAILEALLADGRIAESQRDVLSRILQETRTEIEKQGHRLAVAA